MSSTRTGGRSLPPADARGQPQPPHPVDGLRARGRRARQQPRAGLVGAVGGDVAGVVARVALVLVGAVVLLVDDDQPEPLDRGEDRRARPDGDPRLTGPQPPPLVVALALAQRRVQQRDRVPEARREARHRLRREGDLRHERDHALATRQGGLRRAQVHLGLAGPGHAVQQVGLARRGLDRRQRRGLRIGQPTPVGPAPGSCAARAGRRARRSPPARASRAGAARPGQRPRARAAARAARPGSR